MQKRLDISILICYIGINGIEFQYQDTFKFMQSGVDDMTHKESMHRFRVDELDYTPTTVVLQKPLGQKIPIPSAPLPKPKPAPATPRS